MSEHEEQAVVPADAPLEPTPLDVISQNEAAVELIQRRALVLGTMRKAAIQDTQPEDWVLNRDPKTGLTVGFLQDVGCQRALKHFGISIFNLTAPQRVDHENGVFSYQVWGDGRSNVTGESVEREMGIRFSDEDFVKTADPSRVPGHVMKAARANLDGRIARKLAGLNAVPVQELEQLGLDIKRCRRGHGFGSGAEQFGADIEVEPGIKASEGPECPECGEKTRFKPAGKTKSGKRYGAFWSCQKYPKCKGAIPHKKFMESRAKSEGRETKGHPVVPDGEAPGSGKSRPAPSKDDPNLTATEQSRVLERAEMAGYKVNEVEKLLTQHCGVVDIALVKQSQLDGLLTAIDSGGGPE